jgi:hypothetical protein
MTAPLPADFEVRPAPFQQLVEQHEHLLEDVRELLSEPLRLIFERVLVQRMSMRHVACSLNLSYETARSRLMLARREAVDAYAQLGVDVRAFFADDLLLHELAITDPVMQGDVFVVTSRCSASSCAGNHLVGICASESQAQEMSGSRAGASYKAVRLNRVTGEAFPDRCS